MKLRMIVMSSAFFGLCGGFVPAFSQGTQGAVVGLTAGSPVETPVGGEETPGTRRTIVVDAFGQTDEFERILTTQTPFGLNTAFDTTFGGQTEANTIVAGARFTRVENQLVGQRIEPGNTVTQVNQSELLSEAVSDAEFSRTSSTPITGMRREEVRTATSNGAEFTVTERSGQVSTESVRFQSGVRSGQFDPVTGQMTFAPDLQDVRVTELNQDGLATTGVVDAGRLVSRGGVAAGGRITGVDAGVADGDAVNVRQLNAETAARTSDIAGVNTRIDEETAARTTAISDVNTRVDNETAARTSAIAGVNTRIDEETAARTTAISTERVARETRDAELLVMIDQERSAREVQDSRFAEQLDAVTLQIAGLDGRVGGLETTVRKLDDQIASSTATAIAMSGGVFLPNTRFNVTANLATYDGAEAGAVQAHLLVNPRFAVNAGVATGFDKGGKTAGRMGITFGW